MPPFNEPEPDVVVARGTCATYLERHPDPADIVLMVEVSDTTYHRDRGPKWAANAGAESRSTGSSTCPGVGS